MATNGQYGQHDQHGQATASEDVFLSPRVVDREAFDNFSDVLRAIVDDAQTVGQTIEAKSSLAKRALAEFAKSEPTMTASIDTAARVLKSMDDRIDRIETLLGRAEEMSNRLDEKSARATQHLDEREASLRATVADLIAQAEARLNTSAIETTTRVEDVLRSTERALDQARVDTSTMHADMAGQLTDLSDRLAGEIADTAAEGRGQLRETMDRLEAEIEPTRSRIEATTADLEERLDRLRKQTLALMGPGVRQLESLCQRGGNLLGRDPEFIEAEPTKAATPGSLADVVLRAEGLSEQATRASAQLESIRTQAETARTALSESIISSSEWLDKLLEYQASLDGATAQSVEHCREAEAALKQREDQLKETLLEPAQTIEREMQRIDELLQHVRASRVEAETLIERHVQVSRQAKQDLVRLEKVIETAERAASAIPETNGHADEKATATTPDAAASPPPDAAASLTEAVEAIKGELTGELSKMTRAIEQMMRAGGGENSGGGGENRAASNAAVDAVTNKTTDTVVEPKAKKKPKAKKPARSAPKKTVPTDAGHTESQ